jgi:DNA-binding HxlR family transcriptional regulator
MLDLGSNIVSIKEIRDGKHPLSGLYNKLNPKTLSRDLDELTKKQLIVIQDGRVSANFRVMDNFTARHELKR